MKPNRELPLIAICLLALSIVIFAIQYELFHSGRDMLFYLFQDLAFLPIQILLVAIIVERVVAGREKGRLLHKMNMVIGVFFGDLGTALLGRLTGFLGNREGLRPQLAVRMDWSARDWKQALAAAERFDYQVDPARVDLAATRDLLAANRGLLTLLLANPNLMEHQRFTDLLWAVSHLLEELTARKSLEGLPSSDREHLAGDVRRVYSQLASQWLLYCQHLQESYPFIFSIMVRTNPLSDSPSAIVT